MHILLYRWNNTVEEDVDITLTYDTETMSKPHWRNQEVNGEKRLKI